MSKRVVIKKLTVNFFSKEEYLYFEIPEFQSLACAEDYASLMKELEEELIFLWESYVMDNDSNLTENARELKYKILESIEVQ